MWASKFTYVDWVVRQFEHHNDQTEKNIDICEERTVKEQVNSEREKHLSDKVKYIIIKATVKRTVSNSNSQPGFEYLNVNKRYLNILMVIL